MSILAGKLITFLVDRPLNRLLPGASADEFGLSADIISGSLGPNSLVGDNVMFSSSTPAPLPLPPIGLGLSDTPSMTAYIATGSPGMDTANSQLIWKQSVNLPDPDLLKHLYEVAFLTLGCTLVYVIVTASRSSLLAIPLQTGFYTDLRSFCKWYLSHYLVAPR